MSVEANILSSRSDGVWCEFQRPNGTTPDLAFHILRIHLAPSLLKLKRGRPQWQLFVGQMIRRAYNIYGGFLDTVFLNANNCTTQLPGLHAQTIEVYNPTLLLYSVKFNLNE